MLCIKRARAHWHLSWIDAHLVINGHKELKMVSNSLKKYKKYHERKKNGDSMFCNGVTRENARACAYARFFIKCLKWPKTYANKIWDDFEHLKILRAHWRADARVFWPEIDRTHIDLDHDKYEWEMNYRYENMIMSKFSENFTKWRLDDVINQGQDWKLCCALFICLYICVPNFKIFDWAIFKLSCTQKSGSK